MQDRTGKTFFGFPPDVWRKRKTRVDVRTFFVTENARAAPCETIPTVVRSAPNSKESLISTRFYNARGIRFFFFFKSKCPIGEKECKFVSANRRCRPSLYPRSDEQFSFFCLFGFISFRFGRQVAAGKPSHRVRVTESECLVRTRQSCIANSIYIFIYCVYSLGTTRARLYRVNGLCYFNNDPKDLVREKVRTVYPLQWRLVVHMTIFFMILLSRFRVRTNSLPAI